MAGQPRSQEPESTINLGDYLAVFNRSPFGLRASYPGIMLTVAHSFTETLKGTVYGGPRFVHSTNQLAGGDVKTQNTVWVYGADLTKQFDNASLQFTLSRDIMPSGFGLLIQRDRAGILTFYKAIRIPPAVRIGNFQFPPFGKLPAEFGSSIDEPVLRNGAATG